MFLIGFWKGILLTIFSGYYYTTRGGSRLSEPPRTIKFPSITINKIPLKTDQAWIPNHGEISGKLSIIGPFDKNKLKELGFIKKADKPVKLLGNGSLSKKITIEVDMVSDSAAGAVKKAGGEVVTIGSGRL